MSEPSIGETVRRLRGEEGRASLAKRAGVHRQYIVRLEGGDFDNPGIETLRKIAAALRVPLTELIAPTKTADAPKTRRIQRTPKRRSRRTAA